jgi:hypothetical protein
MKDDGRKLKEWPPKDSSFIIHLSSFIVHRSSFILVEPPLRPFCRTLGKPDATRA